jgi:Abortive infection C-terminus
LLIVTHPRTKALAPAFLKTNRDLHQFWQFIKKQSASYQGRREYLWSQFAPLLDELECKTSTPADPVVSEVLSKFDVVSVHKAWEKAMTRRREDPEGALTSARTLLETVCKHILDQAGGAYSDDFELPKLYKLLATELRLAPSQHSEAVFKQILGGCTAVVEGLGALRNKLSDSHGKGVRPVRPDGRHAELAVNLAGSMATFLIETWEHVKN